MQIVITVQGIISVDQAEALRRAVGYIVPGASVVVAHGSHARPIVGPSETKTQETAPEYVWSGAP